MQITDYDLYKDITVDTVELVKPDYVRQTTKLWTVVNGEFYVYPEDYGLFKLLIGSDVTVGLFKKGNYTYINNVRYNIKRR